MKTFNQRRAFLWMALIALLFCLLPGAARAVVTITGTAGSTINASVSAPSAGDFITGSSIQTPFQSVTNDLATIKVQQPRNALVAFALVGLGGAVSETLHPAMSGPSLTVTGTTRFGTPSTVAVVSGLTVATGDAIDAALHIEWAMSTHATVGWLVLYATIGSGSPIEIPGAHCYINEGLSTGTRARASMEGRLIATSSGALTVQLFVFLGGSDNWDNLGGGSIRARVFGGGL